MTNVGAIDMLFVKTFQYYVTELLKQKKASKQTIRLKVFKDYVTAYISGCFILIVTNLWNFTGLMCFKAVGIQLTRSSLEHLCLESHL